MELTLAIAKDRVFTLSEAACNRPHYWPQRRRKSDRIRAERQSAEEVRRAESRMRQRQGARHRTAHRLVAQRVKRVQRLVVAVIGQARRLGQRSLLDYLSHRLAVLPARLAR